MRHVRGPPLEPCPSPATVHEPARAGFVASASTAWADALAAAGVQLPCTRHALQHSRRAGSSCRRPGASGGAGCSSSAACVPPSPPSGGQRAPARGARCQAWPRAHPHARASRARRSAPFKTASLSCLAGGTRLRRDDGATRPHHARWSSPASAGAPVRRRARWDPLSRTRNSRRRGATRPPWGGGAELSMLIFGGAGEAISTTMRGFSARAARRPGKGGGGTDAGWTELPSSNRGPPRARRPVRELDGCRRPGDRRAWGLGNGVTSDLWVLHPPSRTRRWAAGAAAPPARAWPARTTAAASRIGCSSSRAGRQPGRSHRSAPSASTTACGTRSPSRCPVQTWVRRRASTRVPRPSTASVSSSSAAWAVVRARGGERRGRTANPSPTSSTAATPPPLYTPRGDQRGSWHISHAMCANGLHVYAFGGFDGLQDRDELWVSLAPSAFEAQRPCASPPTSTSLVPSSRRAAACGDAAPNARRRRAQHDAPERAGAGGPGARGRD